MQVLYLKRLASRKERLGTSVLVFARVAEDDGDVDLSPESDAQRTGGAQGKGRRKRQALLR